MTTAQNPLPTHGKRSSFNTIRPEHVGAAVGQDRTLCEATRAIPRDRVPHDGNWPAAENFIVFSGHARGLAA